MTTPDVQATEAGRSGLTAPPSAQSDPRGDVPHDDAPSPPPDPTLEADHPAAADTARHQRLSAWLEVGATSVPALLVALGSAIVGTVTMLVRRRRRV